SIRVSQMTRDLCRCKLLLLHLCATWCPPCIGELPSLNQMARTLGPKGVVVLGISVDQDKKAYDDFLRRFKLSFEVAHDPAADIASEYGTFKYPETYVITPDGTVVEKFIADRDWMEPALLKRLESHIR
ncbi:MAG: TlpA family protein disulfide reductase, partial [Acidobacteriota bacterium]